MGGIAVGSILRLANLFQFQGLYVNEIARAVLMKIAFPAFPIILGPISVRLRSERRAHIVQLGAALFLHPPKSQW